MNSFMSDFRKNRFESRGRKRATPHFSFSSDQIMTPGTTIYVSPIWNAYYVNLHPTHYAVASGPDGRVIHLRGGYNFPLPAGRYTLHYVDKQNRVFEMPRVSETTRDGAQVSLDLIITYRVIDPVRALGVQQPVGTLLAFINSDLKELIRSHKYDEIIGDNNERTIENGLVSRYIKDQHASRHQISKLFFIEDVVIDEKIGDPKLTEIRENFQVQQRQNVATSELSKQNQELAKKVASQDAEIKQIKAQSEADQQEITQKMKMQSLEFERARSELQAELQYRQETMMQAMSAVGQALSASGYPLDARAMEIIRDIIGEFRVGQTGPEAMPGAAQKSPASSKQPGTFNAEKVSTLTDTLLNWLNYKR
jgi:regulator of protease activity HflC (stomatin/prohibitin superfamily)